MKQQTEAQGFANLVFPLQLFTLTHSKGWLRYFTSHPSLRAYFDVEQPAASTLPPFTGKGMMVLKILCEDVHSNISSKHAV